MQDISEIVCKSEIIKDELNESLQKNRILLQVQSFRIKFNELKRELFSANNEIIILCKQEVQITKEQLKIELEKVSNLANENKALEKDLESLKIRMETEKIHYLEIIDFLENESQALREENGQLQRMERKNEIEKIESRNHFSYEDSVLCHLVEEYKLDKKKLQKSMEKMQIELNFSNLKTKSLQNSYDRSVEELKKLTNQLDEMKIEVMESESATKIAVQLNQQSEIHLKCFKLLFDGAKEDIFEVN